MKATVKWIGDELFIGTSESGHTIVLDANAGAIAPSPLAVSYTHLTLPTSDLV